MEPTVGSEPGEVPDINLLWSEYCIQNGGVEEDVRCRFLLLTTVTGMGKRIGHAWGCIWVLLDLLIKPAEIACMVAHSSPAGPASLRHSDQAVLFPLLLRRSAIGVTET